ncbi:MAG: hypothetical protein LBH95_01620 [Oscillospiraceae bacterium]|jgi:hypothetical protein|nr:hypothetical protein [Oscillospiraceae bacterium]
MKKAFSLIMAFALILSFSIPAFAAAEVLLQGEDVYGGNINNGDGMGGTADDNAADLQPGEKLSFTLPAGFTEGEYKVELHTTGNRTDYNIYIGAALATEVKRPEGTGWGFDWMTTDAAKANITLKAGDVLAVEAPDNGEYGWVDWVRLTLVNAAQGSGGNNPKTGDGIFVWLVAGILCVSSGAFVFFCKSVRQKQSQS